MNLVSRCFPVVCALLVTTALVVPVLAQAGDGWLQVDYSQLLDRRELTHSGESVGLVLDRLAQSADADARRRDLSLLDPHLETYGFVMSDALDAQQAEARRWVEIGWLWEPGTAGPAWVELLRSRRFVVQADGKGTVRVLLPSDKDIL